MTIDAPETEVVDAWRVSCDGGEGATGVIRIPDVASQRPQRRDAVQMCFPYWCRVRQGACHQRDVGVARLVQGVPYLLFIRRPGGQDHMVKRGCGFADQRKVGDVR